MTTYTWSLPNKVSVGERRLIWFQNQPFQEIFCDPCAQEYLALWQLKEGLWITCLQQGICKEEVQKTVAIGILFNTTILKPKKKKWIAWSWHWAWSSLGGGGFIHWFQTTSTSGISCCDQITAISSIWGTFFHLYSSFFSYSVSIRKALLSILPQSTFLITPLIEAP